MSASYRLVLVEDDQEYSSSIRQSLNRQSQFPKTIDVVPYTYQEFERQINLVRNSSREIIVFGGRACLNFAPDTALLRLLLAQQERTHFFVLTPSLEGREILDLWHPGIFGVVERNATAKHWLVLAIQRVQNKQKARKGGEGRLAMAQENGPSKGFFGTMRAAFYSFFL
ncbi:hypothetical protein GU926_17485 [Nibribacter ruber]|uniref:Response regulatory domain-containing protein n=1 Tax=Nibribacter ruber TaxID=2698458 RepID=A0A6P1P3U5_9BACT|nr:hypothetical protein [Nibribacter ruber]QHL89124.1 hypothetical protein GU926_17485 [Nibribacter ruber]